MEYEIEYSYDEICRICLKCKDNLIYLFDKLENSVASLDNLDNAASLIFTLSDVKISNKDEYQFACRDCVNKLEVAYEVIKKCVESDKSLRESAEKAKKPVEEPLFEILKDSEELTVNEEPAFEEIQVLDSSPAPPIETNYFVIDNSVILPEIQTLPVIEIKQIPSNSKVKKANSPEKQNQETETDKPKPKKSSKSRVCLFCKHCYHKFCRLELYEDHMKNGNCVITRTVACDLCPMKFVSKSTMISHRNCSHMKILNYQCHLCQKNFPTSSQLKRHTLIVHNKINPSNLSSYLKKCRRYK